ncbi:hypothetical protein D3C84_1127750 [compost metagenome]
MLAHEPQFAQPGTVTVADPSSGAAVRLHFDSGQLEAAVEPIAVADARLGAVWGERLYRLVLRPRENVRQGSWELKVTQV